MCLIASLNDCHLITMDNWNFSLVRYMCVSMFVCLFFSRAKACLHSPLTRGLPAGLGADSDFNKR